MFSLSKLKGFKLPAHGLHRTFVLFGPFVFLGANDKKLTGEGNDDETEKSSFTTSPDHVRFCCLTRASFL